ncbi:hypothetical protein JEQ07_23095, partial [Serratia proteamaculans]|nr:hypothetical protein [Serratia proteamaculans]
KGDQLSFALQGTAHRGLAWRKWGSDDRPTVLELDVDGGIWLINVDHTKDDKAALGVNGVVNCEGVNLSNARMTADGNIWGTCWGGDYLSNYLNNNFSKKTDAIEDIQLGAQYTVPYQPIAQSGGVLTGLRDTGQTYYCRPIQKKINGTWYTVGQV